MEIIYGRNVAECWTEAVQRLDKHGVRRDSRNGAVLMFPTPVTSCYQYPKERVLMDPVRDANPFFHLFESLWMLAGREDVAFLSRFIKGFGRYSDNGKTLHGAYGWRWRNHFGIDQLDTVINMLQQDPNTRRAVISMWDTRVDLGVDSKDIPCNNLLYPWIDHNDQLCMTIICRSNDVIWGAYGANAVHFSVLQEYIACALGRDTGPMWQVSNNLHMYEATAKQAGLARNQPLSVFPDWYSARQPTELVPLMTVPKKQWDEDLLLFMDHGPIVGFRDRFFRRVVTPMWHAHQALRKTDNPDRFAEAQEILEQCAAADWRHAAQNWVERRARPQPTAGGSKDGE